MGVAAADEVDGIVVEGAGRTVGDLGCRIPVVGGCVCVSGGDCVSARFRISDLLGDDRADGGEEARRGHLDAEEARTRHGHRRDVGMAAKRLGELLGDVMGVGSVEASRGAQGKVRMPVTGGSAVGTTQHRTIGRMRSPGGVGRRLGEDGAQLFRGHPSSVLGTRSAHRIAWLRYGRPGWRGR
ncbi:hypothetical protein K4X33_08005 [Brevibacterium casei]|nr:hypothetical protein K4X33_08005 [Brevibacterium casei]